MKAFSRTAGAALAGILALVALTTAPSLAQPVTILINGQVMTYDQPPITQAGRVFVPLRGIFESLGASVVYQNGTINATGNGRNVSLHIGSTQATIDGQPTVLDVAPFMIGPRTMVPLRFVAQALGASVNYNSSQNTVQIASRGGAPGPQPIQPPGYPVAPPGGMPAGFYIANTGPTGSVSVYNVAVRADFNIPLARQYTVVTLDGRDVSQYLTYRSPRAIEVVLPYPVNPGQHRVDIRGRTVDGRPFSTGWHFIADPRLR